MYSPVKDDEGEQIDFHFFEYNVIGKWWQLFFRFEINCAKLLVKHFSNRLIDSLNYAITIASPFVDCCCRCFRFFSIK